MRIEYLADHLDFILLLAEWHHSQWAYLHPGQTIDERAADLRREAGRHGIPMTVVAVSAAGLLGSASLIAHDMSTHLELSPWLASVYVAPRDRRKGVGSALVRRIVDEARALGVPELYLFTSDRESFYARLGWRVRSREVYHGEQQVIMEMDLGAGT